MKAKTELIPQEIFLLERYISIEYFADLREIWSTMVDHVDVCLDRYLRNLPADYRSRPLPEQPDVVWGNRALPNFRNTLQNLHTGYTLLSHGDSRGLDYAHGPVNDFRGQTECWSGWMGSADEATYYGLLNAASEMAFNISTTEGAYWRPLSLSKRPEVRGPLNFPSEWPTYSVNGAVSVYTGEVLPCDGIYLPDIESSCAAFLATHYKVAPKAKVIVGYEERINPATGDRNAEEAVIENRPCLWHLVERTADTGGGFAMPPQSSGLKLRFTAGEICSAAGVYFTPSHPDSRRKFQKGEVLPDFESAYGTTIWQLDDSAEKGPP